MVVEEVEEPPVEEALLLQLGEVALVVVADAEVARDHAAADRALVQFSWNGLKERSEWLWLLL